jgi:hypothetical protein
MTTHELIRLAQEAFDKAYVAEKALPLTGSFQSTRDNLWDIMTDCLTIQRLIYTSQLSALERYGITANG